MTLNFKHWFRRLFAKWPISNGIRVLLQQPGQGVTGHIRFGFTWCRLDDVAKPMVGASLLAGSETDWSFLRDARWREGLPLR
jgi:hypothetical protein